MSNKAIKNGKQALSTKEEDVYNVEYEQVNMLTLDPKVKKFMDERGLVPRWLNAKEYSRNGNFHRSGWKAWRLPDDFPRENVADFTYGISPEGYLQRLDLILGYKTKEHSAASKRQLAEKTRKYKTAITDTKEEFKRAARRAGMSIDEEFDGDSGDE